MFVKICGLTDEAGVDASAGADAVGFVFAESPRAIAPQDAARLAARLPESVLRVAVFSYADEADILAVCAVFRPDLVQVEGCPVDFLPTGVGWLPVFHDHDGVLAELAAFAVNNPGARVILEGAAVGGQGVRADASRAQQAASLPLRLILAGGLSADNVGGLIETIHPHGVDVSSGVESRRGVKDPERIHQFINAARAGGRRAS